MEKDFTSENGFGGIRYYNNIWQYYDKHLSTWVDMEISNTNEFITIKEKSSIIDEMNDLIGDNTNFFYKKTIYKVKKGDK